MQERINRLENLVLAAIGEKDGPLPSNRSTSLSSSFKSSPESTAALTQVQSEVRRSNDVMPAIGVLEIKDNRSQLYTGDTAWSGILHEISDLKSFWSETRDNIHYTDAQSREQDGAVRPLMVGLSYTIGSFHIDRKELTESLPPKEILDQLVAMFFGIYDPTMPAAYVLHQSTYVEECRIYTENPKAAGNTWLGGLYSMLCLALRFWHADPNIPQMYRESPMEYSDYYCRLAAKCLTLGDITNPAKGTIEACILFLHAGFTHNRNDITRTWLTAGDILRLAMRMGYHREPSQFPGISPFDAEMRRRVFNFVYQTDLLCSFQIGLLPVIRRSEYDTRPSHHFSEDQLSPTMVALPPPLDDNEATYYSYFVAQNRVFRVFGDIIEQLHTVSPPPHHQILELNDQLARAFEQAPPHLRRSIPDSTTDPPRLVLQRIELELFYHKVNCVLHRRYLTAYGNPDFAISRQACIDSALRLLSCQFALHDNKRWPHVEWWASSFNLHDFILAGTVLLVYLSKYEDAKNAELDQIRQALATSHSLWAGIQHTSIDAGRAFKILDRMKGRLEGCPNMKPRTPGTRPEVGPEGPPDEGAGFNIDPANDQMLGLEAGTMDFASAIDWDVWDSYFRNIEPLDFSQVNQEAMPR